jgi:hypothetical protein
MLITKALFGLSATPVRACAIAPSHSPPHIIMWASTAWDIASLSSSATAVRASARGTP